MKHVKIFSTESINENYKSRKEYIYNEIQTCDEEKLREIFELFIHFLGENSENENYINWLANEFYR